MRKLFWQISATLDGFMEGPNHELDYTAQVEDEDFDRYASGMLNSIGAIVLGRRTYQLFADYWPSAEGADAKARNELPKTVFSRTLQEADWKNSTLARENVAATVTALKQQPGKDIAVFGSADLASTLMQLGLIDEYRFLVTPFVLGSGTPMFKDIKDRVDLKLLKTTAMSSGIVALYYQPQRDGH